MSARHIEHIVLVSGSPRRRALLDQLGISYSVFEPNVDETAGGRMSPAAYVRTVALRKLTAYIEGSYGTAADGEQREDSGTAGNLRQRETGSSRGGRESEEGAGPAGPPSRQWALAADTAVAVGRRIIGKPADRREAEGLLRLLSGRAHRVVTAVALYNPHTRQMSVGYERTKVVFAPLSEEEIDWYLESLEWQGVAGGYRIQERGSVLVRRIDGSYSNVVGLPIQLFYGMVQSQGYNLFPIREERIR